MIRSRFLSLALVAALGVFSASHVGFAQTAATTTDTTTATSTSTTDNVLNNPTTDTNSATTTDNGLGDTTSIPDSNSAATDTGTLPNTTTEQTQLDAPAGVAAANNTDTSIVLSWTAPTSSPPGALTYLIIRNGDQVATTTDTSYTDTGLAPDTTYAYNVSASDGSGNSSPWSPTVFATTLSGADASTGSTTTPPVVTPDTGAAWGWAAIPLSVFNAMTGNSTSTTSVSPTSSSTSPFTYVNGYPTVNGNYVDCNGNIDNDMTHHTTNPNDKDPAHHIGMSCPNGGMPVIYGDAGPTIYGRNGQPVQNGNDLRAPQNFIVNMLNGSGGVPWVVIPLTYNSLQQLMSVMANNPNAQADMMTF